MRRTIGVLRGCDCWIPCALVRLALQQLAASSIWTLALQSTDCVAKLSLRSTVSYVLLTMIWTAVEMRAVSSSIQVFMCQPWSNCSQNANSVR